MNQRLGNRNPSSRAELIVVGAGSAGCLLAARLSQQFAIRVTLIEPESKEAPAIDRQRPCRWLNLLDSPDDWSLKTRPVSSLASRSLCWPRGRGLGGCGRINAMIWFPPTPTDLWNLCRAADNHWTTQELDEAYQCMVKLVEPQPPTWISQPAYDFLRAVEHLPDSIPMVYHRLYRDGRRWIPSELLSDDPAKLEVIRGTVDRLIWSGDAVIGVRVIRSDGKFDLLAEKGVVLAAGTIATPTLLMRSGVGPRDELARHKIETRIECPSMGHHLQDHLIMPVVFQRVSSQKAYRARPSMRDLARWMVLGTGPIASNLAECGGLFCARSIQVHVTPTHYLSYPNQDATASMTIGVNVTQPTSTGLLRLTSTRPEDPPEIEPSYFDQPLDLERTIAGVQFVRELVERTSLGESIHTEVLPGGKRFSNESIARAIARYAQTLYHPTSTCRLGRDSDAVIDHDFSLRKADRLWVVDASILPQITVGNPNATIMMLACFAAERLAAQW